MSGRRVAAAVVTLAVLGSIALRAWNLGADGLELWDESFHAVVARNLVKHPLQPTLIDVPYLPYDATDWHENHVWLHKPVLPLWQIAGSFALFGVSRATLRLPSLLLSAACVWLTYAIGRRLVDRTAGAVAAVIHAASPMMALLVHGRMFADHVDVSLLFWTELGVLFLLDAVRSGRWRHVVLAGVATGCAYLSKSYLAAIIPGLALAAWALPRLGVGDPAKNRLGGRQALGILGIAALVIAPWTLYTFLCYREEFLYEHVAWWRHLAGQWEDWGAPWQRVAFDYLPVLHFVFYTPIVVAFAAMVVPAVREKSFGLCLLLLWVAGVFVPHLIAPTKTPTATLIAMPPLLLLLGAMISRSLRGDLWSQAAWFGIGVAAVFQPAKVLGPGRGHALDPGLPSIFAKAPWVFWHVAVAGVVAAAAFLLGRHFERAESRARACRNFRGFIVVVAAGCSLWLLAQLSWSSVKLVTQADRIDPGFLASKDEPALGRFVRENLPANAVLVFDRSPSEVDAHPVPVMFHADRTCYGLRDRDLAAVSSAIRSAGGKPYLVTFARKDGPGKTGPALYESASGRSIHELE